MNEGEKDASAAQPARAETGPEDERRTREALLFLLEDVQRDRDLIRQAKHDWLGTVDAVQDPLMIHDARFRIVRANRAYAERAGMGFAEMIGRPYWECFPKRDGPLSVCTDIAAGRGSCAANNEEFSLDSGEIFLSRTYPMADAGGNYYQSLHLFEDITERRRAEQQLRLVAHLVENSPSVLFRWRPEPGWPVAYVSKNVAQWGYVPDHLVSGRCVFSSLVHPEDLDRVGREVAEYTAHALDRFEQEYRLVTNTGDVRWVNDHTVVERDAQGKVLYYQGVVTDVTDRRREESARQERMKRAEQQSRVLSDVSTAGELYTGDVEALARRITEAACGAMGVERANVWLFDDTETELRCIDCFEATPSRHTAGMVLTEAQYTNEFRALKAQPFVDADDALTDPRTAGYVESYIKPLRISAMLDVDIQVSDRHLGLLCLEHVDKPHQWKVDEITFARQLADKIALTLTNRGRARSQESLRASEEKYRVLFESSRDAFMTIAPPGWRFLSGNAATLAMFRVADEAEFTSKAPWELSPERQPDGSVSAERAREMIDIALRDGNHYFEWTHRRIDGEEFPATVLLTRLQLQDRTILNASVRDVTELRRAEREIRVSEQRYHSLFTNMLEGFARCEMILETGKPVDFVFREINPAFTSLTGLSDVVGKRLDEVIPGLKQGNPDVWAVYQRVAAGGAPERLETYVRSLDIWFSVFAYPAGENNFIAVFDNITGRKRAEESLRASRDLLGRIIENIPIRVFWKDLDSRYLGCNTTFALDAARDAPEDLVGKDDFQMIWHDQAEQYRADDREVMDSGVAKIGIEEPQTAPDGRTLWLRTSKVPLHRADGTVFGLLGVYEDITAHKQAERDLLRLNRALTILSAGNEALVRATDIASLMSETCRLICGMGGYRAAFICREKIDRTKSFLVEASHGIEITRLDELRPIWGESKTGQGVVGRVLRTGQSELVRDVVHDPALQSWWQDLRELHVHALFAAPLQIDSKGTWGVLVIASAEPDAFSVEEVGVLGQLAADLGYGIMSLQARADRQRVALKLRQSLESTIAAISATVERRDPYTAGHQRRVAELAGAIGREMGMPEEQVHGLHLAGTVHDLGKIGVPAELLSKPGKLSAIEYSLVKEHAQVGHDILKDVQFPWPIARMVLEHHERLDGSGYPSGLKKDEVLLESRILAVADVVEAMSSHRPYRPGLGIDAALQEVAGKRGLQFDERAVDACLRVFREGKFSFSTPGMSK